MAEMLFGDDEANYRGLPRLYGYVNDDGERFRTNCGQAAIATFLTHHGILPLDAANAAAIMARIEATHPPNILFGRFGTSRRQIERACRAFGCPVREVVGETALRAELDRKNPVFIMLGMPGGKFAGITWPSGHWMIAYGYDADDVFLSNYGRMTWAEFRKGWRTPVAHLIRMAERGLTADAGETTGKKS